MSCRTAQSMFLCIFSALPSARFSFHKFKHCWLRVVSDTSLTQCSLCSLTMNTETAVGAPYCNKPLSKRRRGHGLHLMLWTHTLGSTRSITKIFVDHRALKGLPHSLRITSTSVFLCVCVMYQLSL